MYPKAGQISAERYAAAMEAKEFFQKFLDADCQRIGVENPVPLKVVGLPRPTQIIQPYEYGHPYNKATCLWLKGLPNLIPTERVEHFSPYIPSNTGAYSRGGNGSGGIAHDPKVRSRTFHGIARAMAEQWAGECEVVL
jgi:hypothetical protein